MKNITYTVIVMFACTGAMLAGGKNNSGSSGKTSQHATNTTAIQGSNVKSEAAKSASNSKASQRPPNAAATEKTNAKSGAAKPTHPATITSADFKSMDTNHDTRVSREEFAASPMGMQHPQLTNKIFDKSKGKDRSVTLRELEDKYYELHKGSTGTAKF